VSRSKDLGIVDRILDSAFAVFGEEGFQGTTVKSIAAKAGLSAGSIYNYFPDKDNLFEEAVGRGWDRFVEELEAIIEHMPRRADRIAALVGSGFSTLERALPLVRGMFFEASRRNILEPKLERVTEAIDRLLAPDPDLGEGASRIGPEAQRKALIRTIILGILASASMETGTPESTVAGLREAIASFLSGFIGFPYPSAIRRDLP
jgi:AcrR family transcriptional regulator